MLNKFLKHSLLSLKVLSRVIVAGIILLGALLWLWSKFWLFPDIERYHADITTIVSQAVQQPIMIGKIEADWHGIRPRLIFTDVRVLDQKGRTTLSFQRLENVLSWMTLVTGQVRLHSLEIEKPELQIRRDGQGQIHIADISLEGEATGQVADSSVLDIILRQSRIVIRDARITWKDELNAAPSLVFRKVNLLVDNDGSRHRFAVTAEPPARLSTNLDVRGDFYGDSFADLQAWHGQAYTQIDYANIPAWKPWLPMVSALKRGQGGVRSWVGVTDGKISQMTVDVALSDVRTQLADDALPLEVQVMRGRLAWEKISNGFAIALRKFSLKLNNGLDLQPVDFYLHRTNATASLPASGEVRANSLELLGLASLADFLPLDSDLRQQLLKFSPSGQVTNLQAKWGGDFTQLQQFDIQANFENLALHRVGRVPGFSGLSGNIKGNMEAGALTLHSKNLKMDAPEIMPEPLQFDLLNAMTSWQKNDQGYAIQYENVAVENEDAAGNVSGNFQTLSDSPGEIDLQVNLTRALVQRTSRYIPLVALEREGNAWVKNALLEGQSKDFSLILRGNLKDFPFDKKDSGIFQIKASATGAAVKYHDAWPHIEQGVAQFTIAGKRLETFVSTAVSVGAHLQNVSVVMPDITSPNLTLLIRGEATGATARFLDFIRHSPVRGYIDEASDDISARGSGKLVLSLDIPLPDDAHSGSEGSSAGNVSSGGNVSLGNNPVANAPLKVVGDYHFSENEVTLPGGIVAQQVSGHLLFTESSLRTKNVAGHVFGGPATVVLTQKQGRPLVAKAQGVMDMDKFRHSATYPILNYLHGSSPWEANISIWPKRAKVQVSSSLHGIQSDLPAPFTKRASEQIPLNFEMRRTAGQETLSLQYGKLLDAELSRREKRGEWVVRGGNIHFGGLPESNMMAVASRAQTQRGVGITGTVPELAVQGWGKLLEPTGNDEAMNTLSFNFKGADVLIQKVSGFGYALNDVRIKAGAPGKTIVANLTAPAVNGEVTWQPQGKGKLTVRLDTLNLQKDLSQQKNEGIQAIDKNKHGDEPAQLVADTRLPGDASMRVIAGTQTFPTVDLAVEKLTVNKISWGKLELLLSKQVNQQEQSWLAERIHVATSEGVMAGDGKWKITPDSQQTQMNIGLDIYNSGRLLSRLGYPDSVKDGKGRLEGQFSWQGGPQNFDVAALDGAMKLDMGKGQFLQVDPGLGKLLSVFSLQALPKRITLDFTDVFSAGFKFDKINGAAKIQQGLMQIDDFKIEGSAAKVTMHGQVDLIQETQDLRVRILPTIGDTVSLLGFVAGPAVGVGMLLANKILREPLDKLVSFEYNVDGTWAAPNVVKLGGGQGAAAEETFMSPEFPKPPEAAKPPEKEAVTAPLTLPESLKVGPLKIETTKPKEKEIPK